MAYVLIAGGILLAYLDYLGTQNIVGAADLIYQEVWGASDPFWKWFGALFLVGLLGYIPDLQSFSTALLVLILCVIILSHSSGFSTLVKGL